MFGRIFSFIYLLFLGTLLYLGYSEKFIPSWYLPFLLAIIFYGIYVGIMYATNEIKLSGTQNLIFWLSTLSIPYALSSMLYDVWPQSFIFQSITVFRISLIVLGLLTTYGVIMYIRAQISYKQKRGNQRIFQEPKKEHKKRWKERAEASKTDKEISITLGRSTESDEKTPPI